MESSRIVESREMWDMVWHTFANVSLTYDLVSSQNSTSKGINGESNFLLENPAKLGILTGFLIACLADFRIATSKFQLDASLDSKLRSTITTFLHFTLFIALASILTPIFIVFFLYRKTVELLLRITLKSEFAGLLEGTDCVWALEESTALSVINVLGIFEKDDRMTDEEFLRNFRKILEERLVSSHFEKLDWLRAKRYGYYYWERNGKLSIEERVRWMDEEAEPAKCESLCSEANDNYVEKVLAKMTNAKLPRGHMASWEILVGRNCTRSSLRRFESMAESKNTENERTIPVLFRIHHCVGDGVALLRLLLESIADSKHRIISEPAKSNAVEKKICIPHLRQNSAVLGIVENDQEILYNETNLLKASMPFTTRIPFHKLIETCTSYIDAASKNLSNHIAEDPIELIKNTLKHFWIHIGKKNFDRARKSLEEAAKILHTIISAPHALLQQTLRSLDCSALHGPILNGEKLLSFWMESDSSEFARNRSLVAKIRDIKDAAGCRFGDVVLAALYQNFHRYFAKINETAPKTMTAVIPARMTAPSKKLSLQNDFSVGLLTLRCSDVTGELGVNETMEETLFARLLNVARSSEKLRKDSDYVLNFWVMKWLSALLPECLLRPVLESHSTLVFSNLPGPQEVSIIGHKLKNVAFWIPHRGKTGLGCSFLTYGGKVHLSISADTALIPSQSLLDGIVRDTVADIEKLHDSISLSCLAFRV